MNNQQHVFDEEAKPLVDFLCSSEDFIEWHYHGQPHTPRKWLAYCRCLMFFRHLCKGSLVVGQEIILHCFADLLPAALFVLQRYLTENLIQDVFADGPDLVPEKVQDNVAMRIALLENRKKLLNWLQQNAKVEDSTHSRYIIRAIRRQMNRLTSTGKKFFP